MKALILFFTLACAGLTSLFAYANPGQQETQLASPKYVSINIEIRELKESGIILREATETLSKSLAEASKNIDRLSPEQLILINSLADKINVITDKLDMSLNSVPGLIEEAQKPSSELLQMSLESIRSETITPVVSAVKTWLIVTVIGLCLLGVALLLAFAYCMKHIGGLGSTLKTITDGYRIIPVEQYNKGNSKD